MARFLSIFAFLLAGCATPTVTQRALVRDAKGRPVSHAHVELWDPTALSIFPSKGRTYSETTTDGSGFCVLTYPTHRPYTLVADQGLSRFSLLRAEAKSDHLEVVVAPDGH